MSEVRNFAVHKNTADKREAREQSANLVADAKLIAADKQVAGYAIVAWTKDWQHSCAYATGGTLPGLMVGPYAKQVIQNTAQLKTNEG